MDEQHRAALDQMWSEMERRAAERGLGQLELEAKRRQFFELVEQQGGDAAVDRLQREWPEILSRTTPPAPDVNRMLGLQGTPTLWLAEHRVVFGALLVAIAGLLGYFGALGHAGRQPFRPGIPGLIYGVSVSVAVIVVVSLWWRYRRGKGQT